MKKISARNKRALIVIVAAAAVYFLANHLVLPFLDRQESVAGEIGARERAVRVARRTIAEQSQYESKLDEVNQAVIAYEQKLIDAKDGASAGVQLEAMVRRLAADTGVRVSRSNPVPDKKIGERYVKISMQLNLECDLPSLVKFLHALNANDKFLLVEEFNLASFRVKDETRIQPRLQISGFIRLS